LNNVVYILGAGFGAPLGIPVMSNFISKAKDALANEPSEYAHFRKVFSAIDRLSVVKNYIEQNLHNIEDILSLMEMGGFVGKRISRRDYIRFIKDVIEYYTPNLSSPPASAKRKPNPQWPTTALSQRGYTDYLFFIVNLYQLTLTQEKTDPGWRFRCTQSAKKDAAYSVITLNYDKILENGIGYILNMF
jgi:hypothetical protein